MMNPFLFRSPASVVTIFGDSVAMRYVLQTSQTDETNGNSIGLTSSWETLSHNRDRPKSASKIGGIALIDVRKEKCIGVSLGPVLAPPPQMVTPNEALPARANIRIPEIISQFHGLVHPAVTVSQVGRLGCSKVCPKAFLSAGLGISGFARAHVTITVCSSTTNSQSNSVRKVQKSTVCEDPLRALPRDYNLHFDLFLIFDF